MILYIEQFHSESSDEMPEAKYINNDANNPEWICFLKCTKSGKPNSKVINELETLEHVNSRLEKVLNESILIFSS